jgi:hypothetical protein
MLRGLEGLHGLWVVIDGKKLKEIPGNCNNCINFGINLELISQVKY